MSLHWIEHGFPPACTMNYTVLAISATSVSMAGRLMSSFWAAWSRALLSGLSRVRNMSAVLPVMQGFKLGRNNSPFWKKQQQLTRVEGTWRHRTQAPIRILYSGIQAWSSRHNGVALTHSTTLAYQTTTNSFWNLYENKKSASLLYVITKSYLLVLYFWTHYIVVTLSALLRYQTYFARTRTGNLDGDGLGLYLPLQ